MRWTWVAVLSILIGTASGIADVVYLTNGKTIEGRTEDLGDYIKVTTVSGSSVKFPKSLVEKIEEKDDPREICLKRLSQLKPDDAEGHFKLALWCGEHDLDEEYGSLLNKTLSINPNHAEAKKRLYEYNKFARDIPVNEQACARLAAEFGPDFKIQRTAHYRICYDCDPGFVQRRAALFESAYKRFYRYFEEKGYTLDVIEDRLEAILLDSREEFVDYIRIGQKRIPPPPGGYIPTGFVNCAGLYSNATNRMIFYNALNDAQYRAIKKQIDSIPYGRLTKESRKRLHEYKSQLSLKTKVDQNVSVTVHEATHQLTFNLGLLNPAAQNPIWVVEGLATYFEAASGGSWYGAGRLNSERLEVYKATKNLPPLNTLLVSDSLFGGSPNAVAANYAASWALTYYLLEENPEEFVKYLRLLREKRPGYRVPPKEELNDFASCFGEDLGLFAARWAAFMCKLK